MARNRMINFIGMVTIQVIEFALFSIMVALFNFYYGFAFLDNVITRFVIAGILTFLLELGIRPSKIAFRRR